MDVVARLGHVTYQVRDLDAAVDQLTTIGQLQLTARSDHEAFLRGGTNHYWVRLRQGTENGLVRVGYEATSEAALDEVTRRLTDRGIEVRHCEDALREDYVQRWLRFTDPDGIEVELFHRMMSTPAPASTPPAMLAEMLHAVFFVADVAASAELYGAVLGFRVSDLIEDAVAFLRCGNGYHHSLGFVRAPARRGQLAHYAVLCEDFDQLMVARRYALDHGADLRDDLLRHAASGSVGFYVKGTGMDLDYEFCVWHERITDPDHQPRVLPAGRTTMDVWAGMAEV